MSLPLSPHVHVIAIESDAYVGWINRAKTRGLHVTCIASPGGRQCFTVRLHEDLARGQVDVAGQVPIAMAPSVRMPLCLDAPTPTQAEIVLRLREIGVLI